MTVDLLEQELKFNEGHANQVFSWLQMKGLLQEVSRKTNVYYVLTEMGLVQHAEGTPEEKILNLLKDCQPRTLPEISSALDLDKSTVGSTFGLLAKEKALLMTTGNRAFYVGQPEGNRYAATRTLLDKAAKAPERTISEDELTEDEKEAVKTITRKRGGDSTFKTIERDVVTFSLNETANPVKKLLKELGITGNEVGQLTSEHLKTGSWREAVFRSYNINLPPARIVSGHSNAYVSFLENIKDKLVGLGFEETRGDLVETDFWNCDALFMPQFHPARDIHDVYYIKEPTHAKSIEEPFLSKVASVHRDGGQTGSRGWQYDFDENFTKQLLLRSQGTVMSVRQLHKATVPGKYFTISRCFRYDKVDATHAADFYQLDGILLGENVNLRTLLGLLKMFAVEIAGATEVKYVPAYFPFTEPSIEVHVKHPALGWIELGGAGIFRPEVTEPHGVSVPALAWGMGIDRMAMLKLGINDVRELFSYDIEAVRLRK